MRTKTKYKKSLSVFFVIFAMLLYVIASSVSRSSGPDGVQSIMGMSTSSELTSVTNVVEFLLEVVVYSL